MTTLRGYGAFYTILTNVRQAVLNELVTRGRDNDVGRAEILTGAIAWDDCDQCGLLALSAQRHFLTDQFPLEVVTTQFGSGAFLGANMAVQLIRCAPQPPDNDLSPSVEALEASAQQVLDDGYTLLCAVETELIALRHADAIVDYIIMQLVYVGPEGACVGSELTFSVAVDR